MANGDMPPRVVDATKIESVWGNSVVDNLQWQRNNTRWFDFTHQGANVTGGGIYDMGVTTIPAVTYPRRVTIMLIGYFGFAGGRTQAWMDIYRYLDGATRQNPTEQSEPSSWSMSPFGWTYTVAPGQEGTFKSRINVSYIESGGIWFGSHGSYHVQRYGTP